LPRERGRVRADRESVPFAPLGRSINRSLSLAIESVPRRHAGLTPSCSSAAGRNPASRIRQVRLSVNLRDVQPRKLWFPFVGWIDGVIVATLVVAALPLHMINGEALKAATQSNLASTELERASQAILTTPYAVLILLEYDDNTQAGRDAPILFRDAVRAAKESMDEAARLVPENAARLKELKSRFEVLAEEAEIPPSIGNTTPGLTRGASLTKTELGQLASGARLAAETDVQMRSLAQDVSALDAALVEANSRAAAGLEARFDAAILTMAGIGLVVSGYFRISGERRVLARLLLRRRRREELRGAQAIDSPGEGLGA
jgi:hypothetical protein